jgi:hypothetical protein
MGWTLAERLKGFGFEGCLDFEGLISSLPEAPLF